MELLGVVSGRVVRIGAGRWDQGPLPFDETFDPALERLIVLGRAEDGAVLASGATGPLDLGGPAGEAELSILFSRVGALSRLEEGADPRVAFDAVGLPDGRVLFFGGRQPDGCAVEATELWDLEGPRAGPRLPSGRVGAEALSLPGGEVLLVGGDLVEGCSVGGPAEDAVLLDPVRNTARRIDLGGPPPAGAAWAVVDASLVIRAGGEGTLGYRTEVVGLDPRRGETRRIGDLDVPRAYGRAASLGRGRVLLVGGLGAPGQPPLDLASVFVTRRGSALSGSILTQPARRAPVTAVTPAGGVLVAGGVGADGEGTALVQVLVATDERAATRGDATDVTSLTSTVGAARGVALEDGSLLLLPEDGGPAHWLRTLPRGASALESPGRLAGAPRADGQVVLRDESGAIFAFNPGPAALLGPAANDGRLALDLDRPPPTSFGLVPLRPAVWEPRTSGLRGTVQSVERPPLEWAAVGGATYADFELEVTLDLAGAGQAALLFGLVDGSYDLVTLGGTAAVGRSPDRAASRPVDCAATPTPELLGGRRRVRLVRRGDQVGLDTDLDGAPELTCAVPASAPGRVALGVARGEVVFDALEVRALR